MPTLFVVLFALFPLTDTDIWWHLACAREWVSTWTPVRSSVVNVHEYFQQVVGFVYGLGGAPLLVVFKAVLWGIVFALFLSRNGCDKHHCELPKNVIASPTGAWQSLVAVVLLFIFRYHFEMRPVLFSLLFLGIYWNVFLWLFHPCRCGRGETVRKVAVSALILVVQWLWCKCQGLYILGPIFATLVLCTSLLESTKQRELGVKFVASQVAFVLFLWLMPFLHREGLSLFLYPFGLLDRLLGLSPSAAIFASQIAENRSPVTLLMAGENIIESLLMIVCCVAGFCYGIYAIYKLFHAAEKGGAIHGKIALIIAALLAMVAERNFVLFLPLFLGAVSENRFLYGTFESVRCRIGAKYATLFVVAFIFGLWARSLSAYDYSMVSYQRVPVDAAEWMRQNPHAGRLFNDDRAGGYLAFVNPADSIYIDGRFILKTADFFERYLEYAKDPSQFIVDADSLNIDRAVFPLRYYARWDSLLQVLETAPRWHLAYRDAYFAVFDKE